MRLPTRILTIVLLAASPVALAAPENPNERGPNSSFYYGSIGNGPRPATPQFGTGLTTNTMRRPIMRLAPVTPVTPVPEPSTWALMLAGFSVVGFIARRGSRR